MSYRRVPHALLSSLLLLAVATVVGCGPPGAVQGRALKPGPLAGKPARPALTTDGASRVAASLTGKVKLIADARLGLVSDHGAQIISDAGAGIVSDHGGGVISNNGGTIISNNAGAYALSAAPTLATFALADAEVTFTDAAGVPLRDAAGQPLKARTDAQGSYTLRADLPPGNLVARIRLFNGGELAALVVPAGADALTLDLDTATTLGAAYVLERFVKGDQQLLDRLPRAEAERLSRELAAVGGFLAAAPSYAPADMVVATEALRTRVPAVDRVIEDVKALLLGQARLGNGRLGTEVPLAAPGGLAMGADGALLTGEGFIGRIRSLAPDGTIETLADAGSGKIAVNFLRLVDIARGPDGTLYAASSTTGLYRVKPDGTVDRVLTDSTALGDQGLQPQAIAVGPDGTLYIGEFTWSAGSAAPRVLALDPGGQVTTLSIDAAWRGGRVSGLAVAPDGALLLVYQDAQRSAQVYRYANGAATRIASLEDGEGASDLAVGPDGRTYVARETGRRVVTIGEGGAAQPVAGAGGPAATAGLRYPSSLAVGPDGTLYVADASTSLVHALRPDGSWHTVAGSDALTEAGETTAFAINQPTAVAFDAAGALYIAETGSSRVRRFRDGKLEVVAGGEAGFGGDGGPAEAAKLGAPAAVAFKGDALWIGEAGGRRIREVTPAGIISTVLGTAATAKALVPGSEVPAAGRGIPGVGGLAFDREGRAVFTTGTSSHQLMRFTPGADGGTLRALSGRPRPDFPEVYAPGGYIEHAETDPGGVLGFPIGVAIGPGGEPYYAELVPCRVSRVVDVDGPGPTRIERVAGRTVLDMFTAAGEAATSGASTSPDGVQATESNLVFPTAVVFDAAGNMFISEAGTIHIAGIASVGDAAASGTALGDLAMKALGMPRIAGRVRKVTPDGVITTVAGRGTRFFPDDSGDNALIMPMALAIAPDGRLAIADVGANMIRILPAGSY